MLRHLAITNNQSVSSVLIVTPVLEFSSQHLVWTQIQRLGPSDLVLEIVNYSDIQFILMVVFSISHYQRRTNPMLVPDTCPSTGIY